MSQLMLKDYINWRTIYSVSRDAEGHSIAMRNFFQLGKLIADNDVSPGVRVVVWFIPGQGHIVLSDYLGSANCCEAWEDIKDDEIKHLCVTLANNAHSFLTLEDVITYLSLNDLGGGVGGNVGHAPTDEIIERLHDLLADQIGTRVIPKNHSNLEEFHKRVRANWRHLKNPMRRDLYECLAHSVVFEPNTSYSIKNEETTISPCMECYREAFGEDQ